MNVEGYESAKELRGEALALHAELRDALRQALDLATRVAGGDPQAFEALAEVADELVGRVQEHLRFEAERLGPFITVADSWGSGRRQLLAEAELLQREALAAAAPIVAVVQRPAPLVVATRRLARAVLRAVRLEERELLQANQLQDEVVVRNQMTG